MTKALRGMQANVAGWRQSLAEDGLWVGLEWQWYFRGWVGDKGPEGGLSVELCGQPGELEHGV